MQMADLKYSRQRAYIKESLMRSHSHPSADAVYMDVKEKFPNISLGTVYRNLNLLASRGEVLKITTPSGADRFDGRTDFHYHVICKECGNVSDIELPLQHAEHTTSLADRCFEGKIDSHTTMFYGYCPDCLKKRSRLSDKAGRQKENHPS